MSYDLAVLVPDIDPKVINPLPQKHTSFIVLMYIKIIIYSIGMVTERERDREVFDPVVHSPAGCNGWGWAKPGAASVSPTW